VAKPQGKRLLGRPMHRWDLEVGWEVMDWISAAQSRDNEWAVVNTVMNLGVP
jgi:hypothetical protein